MVNEIAKSYGINTLLNDIKTGTVDYLKSDLMFVYKGYIIKLTPVPLPNVSCRCFCTIKDLDDVVIAEFEFSSEIWSSKVKQNSPLGMD